MSSELNKLIDLITDMVVKELETNKPAPSKTPRPSPVAPTKSPKKGAKILVAPGPRECESGAWQHLSGSDFVAPTALVWNGFRQDCLPSQCSSWSLEPRTTNWHKVATSYKGVVLLGSDLSVLSGLANLGAGGGPPASVAVAAVAAGLPVFVEEQHFEAIRRHSSRLASGFVRRFEDSVRTVASFGVEFGGPAALQSFLGRFEAGAPVEQVASRKGGRAVITVEDVEAVKRSGDKKLALAMGTIVTPLAAQRAQEWGIEVIFQ